MPTKRSLNRQLADARAQVRRLVDVRDDIQVDADTEQFSTRYLAKRLDEAREENDGLRRQLDEQRPTVPTPNAWKEERSRLLRRLDLSERARADLDVQLRALGQINERLTREAYNRAEAAR